jgi:hypothetical protein
VVYGAHNARAEWEMVGEMPDDEEVMVVPPDIDPDEPPQDDPMSEAEGQDPDEPESVQDAEFGQVDD